LALEQARRDAADRNHYAEMLHLREAKIHRQAARVTEQTAALYRDRVRQLIRAQPRLGSAGSGVRAD